MMKDSFFFGPENCQLFGSYYHPSGEDKQVLTVFCPPLFTEFSRTYRTLHKLAVIAAQSGQHVLRFDYRGTGDSSGELEKVTIKDWIEDIRMAILEGQEISGCRKVQIFGVRAGALLASASLTEALDIARLVFWDPVPDGAGYISALQSFHNQKLENNFRLTRAERKEAMRDLSGWHICEQMWEEIKAVQGELYSKLPKDKLHLITTSLTNHIPVQAIAMDLIEYPCNWDSDDENTIDPLPVLEHLSKCLTAL